MRREAAPWARVTPAQVLFDRFHLVQYLSRPVDEVRRSEMRRLSGREKSYFKRTRFLLLKNPWSLRANERLSALARWNSPIVRAYYPKEAFQLFCAYRQPARAEQHLERWMHSAMRSRLAPFKDLVRMLRAHLDGLLAWTRRRVPSGALESMNNKIKLVSHPSFGFRTVENFKAAIYRGCAHLPLPPALPFCVRTGLPAERRATSAATGASPPRKSEYRGYTLPL